VVYMERPFEDDRPVGPFVGQSDSFRDRFLSGSDHTDISEGDIIMVEVISNDSASNVQDMLDDIGHSVVQDYVDIHTVGEFEGSRDVPAAGDRSLEVAGVYVLVGRMDDPDVSLQQLEEFYRREIQGSGLNVRDLTMAKVDSRL